MNNNLRTALLAQQANAARAMQAAKGNKGALRIATSEYNFVTNRLARLA